MTTPKTVEEVVEHVVNTLKQSGFIASTLNRHETADHQLRFEIKHTLLAQNQAADERLREVAGELISRVGLSVTDEAPLMIGLKEIAARHGITNL